MTKNLYDIYRKVCNRANRTSDQRSMQLAEEMKLAAKRLLDDPSSSDLIEEFGALEQEWADLTPRRRNAKYFDEFSQAISEGEYFVERTFRDAPSNSILYVAVVILDAESKSFAVKIGVSESPLKRLRAFVRRYRYEQAIVVYRIQLPFATYVESVIHRKFARHRIRGHATREMFAVDPKVVVSTVQEFLAELGVSDSGDTELEIV